MVPAFILEILLKGYEYNRNHYSRKAEKGQFPPRCFIRVFSILRAFRGCLPMNDIHILQNGKGSCLTSQNPGKDNTGRGDVHPLMPLTQTETLYRNLIWQGCPKMGRPDGSDLFMSIREERSFLRYLKKNEEFSVPLFRERCGFLPYSTV